MPRESTLTTTILRSLHHDYGAKAIKIHGSAYSLAGTPDIIGCLPGGRLFALEVKKPDRRDDPPFYVNVETYKQFLELRSWQQAGALVGVVRSLKDMAMVLELEQVED